LVLRELTASDAPSYEKHFVDYEVIRDLSAAVPWPYPAGGVAEYINNHALPNQGRDRWIWAITLKTDPSELIGLIDLWRKGTPENRGFWLGRAFWGHGYMSEAVVPVMDFAFNEAGFDKLIFTNAVGNSRSGRIKEKTGARRLRTEPARYVDPSFAEREVWELVMPQRKMEISC
jgi:[ribosomal protein S5]-alanine N-acetyltransferase